MAVIRDVMPVFELYQPASIDDAIKLLDKHGADALVLAGGLDSMDWLKDRLKKPKAVVDLGQIKELRGMKEVNGGIEIGAMTPLTEVVKHPVVREKFSLLMEAAELVASPQIRNQGTIGGNVSQDTRCWYYRGGWTCYRAGGNICYADTPTAVNREHAIFNADRCVAVNPSDTAPALVALDASMVIRGPKGERVVPAEEYWIGPGIDITRMNVLAPNEILTAIRIPATMAGAQFYFEKVRDRQVWDFPLVNVASAMVVSGDKIDKVRLVVNAVAATPHRLTAVETAIIGKTRDEATADMAGKMAVEGAQTLRHNALQGAADAESREARHSWRSGSDMDLLRWGRSPWGEWVLTHVSWSLFWASLFAGVLFFVAHASYMLFSAHRKRSSAETDALEAQFKNLPPKIERHGLTARMFHWVMAASMFVLLFTAFLPIAGIRFAWVQWHWIAGLVLIASILFHIVHATFFLDFWSIWVGPKDIPELKAEMLREFGHDVPGPKSGKYPLGNRLYHLAIVFAGLGASITGALMIPRIRTGLVARNPYYLERRHVGHHLRDARSRGRRARRPGDRARLLRGTAGEVVDHEVDDPRLHHAPAVSRAS